MENPITFFEFYVGSDFFLTVEEICLKFDLRPGSAIIFSHPWLSGRRLIIFKEDNHYSFQELKNMLFDASQK